MKMLSRVLIWAGLAGLMPMFGAFAADVYPARPVRIIVGFTPGGGTDLVARMVAGKLGEQLKSSFIVENKVGASGNIAGQQVATAKPDGYMLLWVPIAHAVNAAIGKDLTYAPVADFAPVSLVMSNPTLINVGPATPINTVRELIAMAKAQPGKVSYASSGVGSSSHIAAALFELLAGVQMLHVPYKGGGDAQRAVLSGDVSISFNDIQASMPLVRGGKIKAIASTGKRRAKILPDIPTVAESGLADYEYSVWFGLLAPKRTPPDIIGKLHTEIVSILKSPDLAQKFEADGGEVIGSSPEEFSRFLNAEVEKWRKVVKAAGIE